MLENTPIIAFAVEFAIILVAAVYISTNRRPSAAIAWILAIILLPIIGILLFLVLGTQKLPRKRRDAQQHVTERMLERVPSLDAVGHRDEWPEWLGSTAQLTKTLGALPMVGGNAITLLPDYEQSFAAMADEIDRATDYVHVEFYILALDDTTRPVFDALARARQRGVTVRVLTDHLAHLLNKPRKPTAAFLDEHATEWHAMLPLRPFKGQWQRPDMRNHRKLVVIDGRVGFSGSQNLIDSTYNQPKNTKRGLHWVDLMMRIEGPAVRELDAVFITDWYSETQQLLPIDDSPVELVDDDRHFDAQVLPSGPTFAADNNLKLFATLLHKAERRISLTSPYFVPEESILLALTSAAERGLDVELFASEIGDQALVYHAQRSYYEALLRAGVRVFLYEAPAVLHAKHFSIDDDVAVVGSSNMDIRSFSLNMEVSMLVHGRAFVDELRKVEDDYRSRSTELKLDEWLARPRGARVRDNLARLTSAIQ
ncbi:MAG: cardiolipin synthase [Thermoleophilia bacterium]|nr:cardiolipin synthase [Thermoleophilia bacterium]